MERRSRRTHHDRAVFKWDFIRQFEHAPLRHDDEFRITAIAIFPHHLGRGAELFVAVRTPIATAARRKIVKAHAVAGLKLFHVASDLFDDASDFMSEREGQGMNARFSSAIVRV